MHAIIVKTLSHWHALSLGEQLWIIIGYLGQLMFTGRFLVQWIASERAGRSVVPLAFWLFSMAGGMFLLAYAIYRRDPVFIVGQSVGLIPYTRNLWLIRKEKMAAQQNAAPEAQTLGSRP